MNARASEPAFPIFGSPSERRRAIFFTSPAGGCTHIDAAEPWSRFSTCPRHIKIRVLRIMRNIFSLSKIASNGRLAASPCCKTICIAPGCCLSDRACQWPLAGKPSQTTM